MGAEPKPASFEKIPLATPFCTAAIILPTIPPVTADGLNAPLTTKATAAGIFPALEKIRIRAKAIYAIAMKGTTTVATDEIRFIPPIRTSPTQTASITDVIITEREYSPTRGIFTV